MNVSPRITVVSDMYRPQGQAWPWVYNAALVMGGALMIALSAQVAVLLPFTPVPVTAQTLAVLLVGVLLGSRRGAAAAAAYFAGGVFGLPLFAAGGVGLVRLAGPTGGYIVGFIAAAFVCGWLAERGLDRRIGTSLLAMLAGLVAIYACGLAWLGLFTGYSNVLALGLVPFIPGELIKLAIAATVLPACWALSRGAGSRTPPAGYG